MNTRLRLPSVILVFVLIHSSIVQGVSVNALSKSDSQFLSQQSGSPVLWKEWNNQTIDQAKNSQIPILVVAGFSHCRRCEAAFGEIFNTPELSAVINQSFVPVLVDGDALPDVFSYLFKISQSVAGASAAPQTIVFTPDLKPIWAASDPGRTELLRTLETIQRSWTLGQREDVLRNADQFHKKFLQQHRPNKTKELPVENQLLRSFFREMAIKFDREFGGFPSTTKTLPSMQLLALSRIYRRTDKPEALEMVEKTLQEINASSIHDHVDGGFFRQSNERGWAPDFMAKVLSDNALVASASLDAWKMTSKPEYSFLTLKTLRFLIEQMSHKSGGFFSAILDRSLVSDQSQYSWNYSDLKAALSPAHFSLLSKVFIGRGQPGSTMRLDSVASSSVPVVLHSNGATFPVFGSPEHKELNQILLELRGLRQKRGKLKVDPTIQVGWNGLAIEVLSRASKTFAQNIFLKHAVDAAEKIRDTAWDGTNLSHMIVKDRAIGSGTLEDYSQFIHGLIALTEATGQLKWLQLAAKLQNRQNELFWSEELSAFFDFQKSVVDHGIRGISLNDTVVPSGNSMSILNLVRLSSLSGNSEWRSISERLLRSMSAKIIAHPGWYPYAVLGVDAVADTFKELVIVAPRDKDLELEQAAFNTHFSPYAPNQVMISRLDSQSVPADSVAAELLRAKKPLRGKTTFYVCQNRTCKLPTTDVIKALEMLQTKISYKVGKD